MNDIADCMSDFISKLPDSAPAGATTTTAKLFAEAVNSNKWGHNSVEALIRVIVNLMQNPSDPTFCELHKMDATLQEIMKVKPCLTLLRRCGFWDHGEQHLRLQKSGLRLGEVARICMILEQHTELCHLAGLLASVGAPRHEPVLRQPVSWSLPDKKVDSSCGGSGRSPQSVDRSRLKCATPGCHFLVNSRAELGGYCCIACSEGGDHGPRCERIIAPKSSTKADAGWTTMTGDELAEKEFNDAINLSIQELGQQFASDFPTSPGVLSSEELAEKELEDAIRLSRQEAAAIPAMGCSDNEEDELAEAIRRSMLDA